jgi:hypothetical protein
MRGSLFLESRIGKAKINRQTSRANGTTKMAD